MGFNSGFKGLTLKKLFVFPHTTYLYFRVFRFLHNRKHTLNITKKNLLFLSVVMNTLYSENHTKLNAGCAMAQAVGRRPTHRGDTDSVPGQFMWDLWCTDCRWDKFYSRVL